VIGDDAVLRKFRADEHAAGVLAERREAGAGE
jgi:hypothetical protein